MHSPAANYSASRPASRFGAWLALVRIPNWVTVPGDPLAGYLLARWAGATAAPDAAVRVCAAAVCLYAAGLILNDRVDAKEDRRTRPHRPLPSGRISLRAASGAACACGLAGLGLAVSAGALAATVAGLLVLCILFYSFSGKAIPVIGPLWMGGCRAFSLLMGAAAAGWPPMLDPAGAAAVGLGLYVAAVTAIARYETGARKPGYRVWLPVAALGLAYGGVFALEAPSPWAAGLAGGSLAWTLGWTWRARNASVAETGALVGALIRGLLLFQAALIASVPGPGRFWALALLAFWPLHAYLSKFFAPT